MERRLLEGRFGAYRLGDLLERTTWCNVYRAHRVQRSLFHAREQFAAKEVFLQFEHPHLQRVAVDEFTRHASRYLGLSHPSLARVVDFVVHGPYHYTLFEFVPGVRLGMLLDRQDQPTEEDLVFHLAADVVRALRYLHAQGLVFGDLSPSSIIITPQGQARLTDFGLSRHLVPLMPDDPLLGTRGYAPPEQYGPEAVLTPQCDLYALGAVMWQSLTLREPASEPAPLAPLRTLNPHTSSEVEAFVAWLTDLDPDRRAHDADEVWLRLVEREPSLEQTGGGGVAGRLLEMLLGRFQKGSNGGTGDSESEG